MKTKKRTVFILVSILFIGIIPWVFYPLIRSVDSLKVFETYVMMIPLIGVLIGECYERKEIDNFSKMMLLLVLLHTLFLFFSVAEVIPPNIREYVYMGFLELTSVCLLLYCFLSEKNRFSPFRNYWQYGILGGMFLLAKVSHLYVWGYDFRFGAVAKELLSIPFLVLIFNIGFFSQEYVWRRTFQNTFQQKFGKKWGIVLLGVIWAISQLPVWLLTFRLEPQDMGIGMFLFLKVFNILGLAAFLGWAYKKTRNIWTCAMLYGLNHFIGVGLVTKMFVWKGIPVGELVWAFTLFLFLFKESYGEFLFVKKQVLK